MPLRVDATPLKIIESVAVSVDHGYLSCTGMATGMSAPYVYADPRNLNK